MLDSPSPQHQMPSTSEDLLCQYQFSNIPIYLQWHQKGLDIRSHHTGTSSNSKILQNSLMTPDRILALQNTTTKFHLDQLWFHRPPPDSTGFFNCQLTDPDFQSKKLCHSGWGLSLHWHPLPFWAELPWPEHTKLYPHKSKIHSSRYWA